MRVWRQLTDFVTRHGRAALITVHDVKGSAPREVGARMAVRPDGAFHGTIGGGQLEFRMLDIARETKISVAHLTAIENESFDELPALVYTRGFVQQIAKFLKLDSTQVTKTYLRRLRAFRAESDGEAPH